MKIKKDLELASYTDSFWTDENVDSKLQAIRNYVLTISNDAHKWYVQKKKNKRRVGCTLRYLALILLPTAGLVPFLFPKQIYLPTIILALAGLCIGIDKYGSFTGSWMRYVKAAQDIKQAITDFHLQWEVITIPKSSLSKPDTITKKIKLCQDFVDQIQDIVKNETDKWIAEFKSALNEMDKEVKSAQTEQKKQDERKRKSGLNIVLTNASNFSNGWAATIDGQAAVTSTGKNVSFSDIEPGIIKLHVEGELNGKKTEYWKSIQFEAGQVVNEEITLE